MCADTSSSQVVKEHSDKLRVTEIFYSLQGESRSVGYPTVFIRLTGCPLRCGYCDTTYAFQGGEWLSEEKIIEEVIRLFGTNNTSQYVTVTGGEPLAQKNCQTLLKRLCDIGYKVSLETSGALDVCGVDARVVKVMDLKTPGSGESAKNLWQNLDCLDQQDQVKFVICDREDYDWVKQVLNDYKLSECCEILFSPVYGQLQARELAEWILEDRLAVRFQIQLHKVLWDEEQGR
jgi:7-carboxy-7-deazaguanine synthase